MHPLIERASNIYRKEGGFALARMAAKKPLDWLILLEPFDTICYIQSLKRLRSRMEAEEDLDDILDTAFNYRGFGLYKSIKPKQIRYELKKLADAVKQQEPSIIMEIGTSRGGTFYTWCRYIDSAYKMISMNLPGSRFMFGTNYPEKYTRFLRQFSDDKKMYFLRCDSHSRKTIEKLQNVIGTEKIDFLLIDGDHRYEGVKQDFEMYKEFVSEHGMIAFHDIVPHPYSSDCEVDKFWNEIKDSYDTEEIISSPDQIWAGIGLIHL